MSGISNFAPTSANATVTVSATATTVALVGAGDSIRIVNSHTGVIFWALGASTISASTTDTPMIGSSVEVFDRRDQGGVHANISIRTLSGAGSASVYVQTGNGS